MATPQKVAVVERVRESLDGAAATLLADYRGLSVGEMAELRAELRKANAVAHIVKNTLARRAAAAAGMEGFDALLTGPNALVYCAEDPVGPAKALKAFAEKHPKLEIRGGYLDGAVLDADAALKLADLASKEETLTKLASLMYGALANTARLLNALPVKQAQLMQALIEAGGAPGAPVAEAPAAEAPAEAVEAPAEDAPADEAPAEDAPAAEAPAEDAPAAEAPAEEAAADETPEA